NRLRDDRRRRRPSLRRTLRRLRRSKGAWRAGHRQRHRHPSRLSRHGRRLRPLALRADAECRARPGRGGWVQGRQLRRLDQPEGRRRHARPARHLRGQGARGGDEARGRARGGDQGRVLHRRDQRRRAEVLLMAPETGAEVVLRLDGITKRFGPLVANDAISVTLRKGEVIALLGENGAGKTTLMSILFGHYTADSGTVEVAGETLPPGRPRAAIRAGVGMVHQHFSLADNLTVLENVMTGTESLWRARSSTAAARGKLMEISARFGLAVDPDARVGGLSVGEQQRVEILKALYNDARILILDEPTA